jgi:hypothetical protein
MATGGKDFRWVSVTLPLKSSQSTTGANARQSTIGANARRVTRARWADASTWATRS